MTWDRGVIGIQLHHVTDLADCGRFLANATAALRSAYTRTEDPRYLEKRSQVMALSAEIHQLEVEARTRLHGLHETDPSAFTNCRDGYAPWPDEVAEGFRPRHTCQDKCLYHDMGVLEGLMQCICGRPSCLACEQSTATT